ncbi:MAG: phosphoribosylformylglycinamidine synthase subunit PurS [Thermoanaerobaculia bacterium]
MKARVTVYPRREILDPQGKAIRDALSRVGFPDVEDVRAGKSFEIKLTTDDPDRAGRELREMCEKLLANTVVEDYSVELLS